MFIVVVNWDDENRVTKFQDFLKLDDADIFLAKAIVNFPRAFIAQAPAESGPRDWVVNAESKTLSLSAIIDPPEVTSADLTEIQMSNDLFMQAWVKRQAAKESKTERQIMDEIREFS